MANKSSTSIVGINKWNFVLFYYPYNTAENLTNLYQSVRVVHKPVLQNIFIILRKIYCPKSEE